MELNKANLLFKGRKLPEYIDTQLRKRRDQFNKSTGDMISLDKTAVSWAYDPSCQLQNRYGTYQIKTQNQANEGNPKGGLNKSSEFMDKSGSIFVDKSPKGSPMHSRYFFLSARLYCNRSPSNVSGKPRVNRGNLK
jgi:hypothetical protein